MTIGNELYRNGQNVADHCRGTNAHKGRLKKFIGKPKYNEGMLQQNRLLCPYRRFCGSHSFPSVLLSWILFVKKLSIS